MWKRGGIVNIHEAFIKVSSGLPKDDGMRRRLERGYDIAREVGKNGYDVSYTSTGIWRVSKASTGLDTADESVYYVDKEGCSCPDAETARAGWCKHRFAVRLLGLIGSLDAGENG
jgi:hypothetical protein